MEDVPLTVGGYYGDMGVDLWNVDRWATEFSTNQVLVMTRRPSLCDERLKCLDTARLAQVLLNLLNHSHWHIQNEAVLRRPWSTGLGQLDSATL